MYEPICKCGKPMRKVKDRSKQNPMYFFGGHWECSENKCGKKQDWEVCL